MKDLKKSFLVRGNNIVGAGGSGEENTIESISVNGVDIAPDENKNVDITVPSIDGLTKDADLATVAKSGNYEDLDNKPEIPSVEGLAKTTDIPTKVSQLENDSNYLSSIPEEYVTETELNAKGYLTEHQDISGKVDKVEGKSLILDTEIARLATVDNYDDTDIKAEIAKKADATTIPSKVSELTNDSNYQTAEQVNGTVTTEIAKVVADAPEDFDTLKEMSDWIAGHEDDASAMNSAISDNKTAITALQTGKADKSEIPTTVAELTDSADYAKKTEIPTELPANGGNSTTVNGHTVKSDVPENAVFTDTIYDDTEVKGSIEELNSNLDGLEFGEIAGGKNLFNKETAHIGKVILFSSGEMITNADYFCTDYIPVIPNTTYVRSAFTTLGENWYYDIDKNPLNSIQENENIFTTPENAYYVRLSGGVPNVDIAQLEEGSVATPYEPYIPSVKMLAEENSQQSNSIVDMKMLGWTVPKECPIQNYVDSDGVFHQRVGRICLYDCDYNIAGEASNSFYTSLEVNNLRLNGELYCNKYKTVSYSDFIDNDKVICVKQYLFIIRDTSCSDITSFKNANKGVYLYYELAEEKTISVDGNEAVTKVNESLGVIGKCKNLLNPTLQTTTQNDVTCTNNGDGTYTLNGTASGLTTFILRDMKLDSSLSYKLTGCPLGGDWDNGYSMYVEKQYWGIDIGKGCEITLTDAGNICGVYIRIIKDTVCNNLVFKPMLTTDLNATYDDFVPYTGDGETLTHDVASLKNDLMFKNVWSGDIYKANETAIISNFSNSKKYLFEFKAKSNAYKQNVIVLGNQVYIEVPLIGHASTIAFTLYRLNISSNGVVTISDVINEDSGASLVNIYEI